MCCGRQGRGRKQKYAIRMQERLDSTTRVRSIRLQPDVGHKTLIRKGAQDHALVFALESNFSQYNLSGDCSTESYASKLAPCWEHVEYLSIVTSSCTATARPIT